MSKKPDAPPQPFRWFRVTGQAVSAGAWSGAAAASAAAASGAGPVVIGKMATIAFVGTAGSTFSGEFMKHRLDDPLPVFDGPTTLLFDMAGTVIALLLFFIPALQLDRVLHPDEALPGVFGFAALFLTAFLLPVLRGLLCNFGLVRVEEDQPKTEV
jgi:hypothetical protein